jgi:diadenosine tetraphosphate (Ap4A) HIT family hydrolase
MPSQKPIFKKEYESIDNYEESTWMGNDTPFMETEYTGVFRDRYPCVPGHTLFIPKKNTPEHIGKSYGLAYQYGNDKVKSGEMAGFNVGMNIGLCAGQTIMWPHIHFIPRHLNDAKEIGGMRHAHPGADHKRYY